MPHTRSQSPQHVLTVSIAHKQNRLLTTLDNNLFILLGSVDQLVPGVLEAVGDLSKDINLDEVLTKGMSAVRPFLRRPPNALRCRALKLRMTVTDLLTPLTAGANIL